MQSLDRRQLAGMSTAPDLRRRSASPCAGLAAFRPPESGIVSNVVQLATAAAAPDAAQQELAILRRRIHAAIDSDVVVVAELMAAWARHAGEMTINAERVMMRCPVPGHDVLEESCVVFKVAEDPAVLFRCRACGSIGDIITAHQLIFGSNVRQAMWAIWVALAGTLWRSSPGPQPTNIPPRLASIVDAAAAVCGIPVEEIIGYGKARRQVEARQLAMYAARVATDLSYPEIGRAFDGRDHTTVIHGVRRVEKLITERDDLREKLQAIQAWVQWPSDDQVAQP